MEEKPKFKIGDKAWVCVDDFVYEEGKIVDTKDSKGGYEYQVASPSVETYWCVESLIRPTKSEAIKQDIDFCERAIFEANERVNREYFAIKGYLARLSNLNHFYAKTLAEEAKTDNEQK